MAKDTVDDAGICNKGADAHARPAAAQEGIRLEDFLDQPSPRAASFPGGIRIVPLGMITNEFICITTFWRSSSQ